MKKIIFLSILIFNFSQISFAQEISNRNGKMKNVSMDIDYVIKFDFPASSKIIVPKNIRQGDFYKVQVDKINLNNYRVQMQIKDTVYYSSALDFPVFGSIDISGLSDIIGSFEQASLLMDSTAQFLPTSNPEELSKAEILSSERFIEDKTKELDSLLILINEERMEIVLARIKAKANSNQFESLDFSLEEKIGQFETIFKSVNELNKEIGTKFTSYTKLFQNSEVAAYMEGDLGMPIVLRKEKEKVDKAWADLQGKVKKVLSNISPENIEKILSSVLQLYSSNTFTSLPIQFTGEEAEVKMSFIPKDSASNLQTYHLSPIKFGRSPWYWSVGPGMYYSKLRNDRVGFETIQVNDSTQNFKVLEENGLEGEIGVSALFHAGRSFDVGSLKLGAHLSVGTGVSLGEEIRARMLYGAGLSFGKKNHLTIDIGRATGYVDRLSKEFENFDPEMIYVEKPSALVKQLQSDWFISVGYMFSF